MWLISHHPYCRITISIANTRPHSRYRCVYVCLCVFVSLAACLSVSDSFYFYFIQNCYLTVLITSRTQTLMTAILRIFVSKSRKLLPHSICHLWWTWARRMNRPKSGFPISLRKSRNDEDSQWSRRAIALCFCNRPLEHTSLCARAHKIHIFLNDSNDFIYTIVRCVHPYKLCIYTCIGTFRLRNVAFFSPHSSHRESTWGCAFIFYRRDFLLHTQSNLMLLIVFFCTHVRWMMVMTITLISNIPKVPTFHCSHMLITEQIAEYTRIVENPS